MPRSMTMINDANDGVLYCDYKLHTVFSKIYLCDFTVLFLILCTGIMYS